jgi:hypothetical protein
LAFGVCAYFYQLQNVPSASGDEGNWMSMALRILHGLPTRLGTDARFVTTAFARMISLSFRLCGVSIASARATLGVSVLAGLVLIFALCAKMGSPRVGLAMIALLATHPWTVWWTRSVVVPYPIALVLAIAGPLAWIAAMQPFYQQIYSTLSTHQQRFTMVKLVLAGQLLVLGFHFTPFTLIPLAACAIWTVLHRHLRAALKTPGPWLAALLMTAHVAPIVVDTATVVQTANPSPRLRDFDRRQLNFRRSIIDGWSGEQTVRDYAGDNAYSSLGYTPSRVLTVLVLAMAWLIVVKKHGRLFATNETTETRSIREFAAFYLPLSLVLFPFILAPARDWWLATIDSERYLFALLAPAVMLVGCASHRVARAGTLGIALVSLYFVLGPNLRTARYFWYGGGPDHGYFSAHRGGAFRGYKVLPGPRTVTQALYETCRDAAAGRRMTIAFDDYSFHPVRVLIRIKPDHNLDSVYLRDAALPADRLLCVALWSPAMFVEGHIPGSAPERNRWVEQYVYTRLRDVRRIANWTQPNGYPLVQVFTGTLREATQ